MKDTASYKRVNKRRKPFDELNIIEENVDKIGGEVVCIT